MIKNKYRKTYSQEFKLIVVKEYLYQGKTAPQLAAIYDINSDMLKRWARKFSLNGEDGLQDSRGKHGNYAGGRPLKPKYGS